nr:50S ribosomal protein L31 [Anaerolineae bacterium]
MKEDLHPTWYPEARVTCSCGNTWVTGSTVPEIKTDVCSNCHPFYTGQQRIVDTEGQVDRFLKRLRALEDISAVKQAEEEAKTSPDLPLEEIGLTTRYLNALAEEGIVTAGDFITRIEEGGDNAITNIKGVGAKTLIDIKRELRSRGFELPES